MIIACWFIVPTVRSGMGFYLLFALAITSSVQLAGVYVVFSSLILPALASEKVKRQVLTAWSVGIVSVLAGIVFAGVLDLPAGPVVVLSYMIAAIAARCFCSPAKLRVVSGGWGA